MAYWLMKSEPGEYSIDDLERDGQEPWDGIRNYQVRNMIRDDMKVGDRAIFYHSSCKEPGAVGVMEIVSEAYPDPTQFDANDHHFDARSDPADPRWLLRDVKFVRKFERTVTLNWEISGADSVYVAIDNVNGPFETDLPAVGAGEYGRVDQGAVAMLLAKLYLNASVYIGSDQSSLALSEVERVIGGPYTLANLWDE